MRILIRYMIVLLFGFYHPSSALAKESDTIVIRKLKSEDQLTQAITYINPVSNSWHYDSLMKTSLSFKKKSVKAFPDGIWIALVQYQQKPYLYFPCDLGNLFKIEISGDILRIHMMETEDHQILSKKPIKDGFSFIVTDQVNKKQQINFYQLDKKRGLSILEFINAEGVINRALMVSGIHLNEFPMIVNKCDAKVQEINFEKIDFEKLLKEKTNF